jgi:CRISPR/Cas system type I-B associated protein Csh2 (Cas7 group RAMP superfamily)
MKKFLFLAFFSAMIGACVNAQNSSGLASGSQQSKETVDAATMLQQTKEKVAPLMTEKTGLTTAQAEKVIEILFEMRQAAGALQNLSGEERSAKLAELKAAKDKKFSELLTPDQIVAVKSFYEEMGKNNEKRVRN